MLLSMGNLLHFGLDGDHLGLHFGALGLIWVTAWKLWVVCGLHWGRQGAPMSYLALLCRRQQQFEGPGGPKGSMGGLKVRIEKSPVDPCGSELWPL